MNEMSELVTLLELHCHWQCPIPTIPQHETSAGVLKMRKIPEYDCLDVRGVKRSN